MVTAPYAHIKTSSCCNWERIESLEGGVEVGDHLDRRCNWERIERILNTSLGRGQSSRGCNWERIERR
jgi:hypothetical protein